MGKKRKKADHHLQPSDSAAAQKLTAPEPEDKETEGGAAKDEETEKRLLLALRAAKWLASTQEGEISEVLSDAARPLIAARASKYEEDAKAAKAAEVQSGKRPPARQGLALQNNKKRVLAAEPSLKDQSQASSKTLQPLQGSEAAEAAEALRWLAARPEELTSKSCKELRLALHPLVEAQLREEKASPAFRITCMLGQRARWHEALKLLAEYRKADPSKRPKLGAYQRWVRELDVTEGDPKELAMLDAIMRVAEGLPPGQSSPPTEGTICQLPVFEVQALNAAAGEQKAVEEPNVGAATSAPAADAAQLAEVASSEEPPRQSVVNRLLSLILHRRTEAAAVKSEAEKGAATADKVLAFSPAHWSVVAHEAAHERQPPNHYDLDIYQCSHSVFNLDQPLPRATERHDVPGVPGAFVLSQVMSHQECEILKGLSDAIGYRPDVPLSSKLDDRAHNVVILASEQQCAALYARVKHLLPQALGGETLHGINNRWRLYRYLEGNMYRKHLDGAWGATGGAVGRSKLTFIVYLTDDFEGGCTTFFVPKKGAEGALVALPVKPTIGNATVFPHGDTGIPLLHEGSPVTKGAKYLLRTEVFYVSPETPAELKAAARRRGLARQLGCLGTGLLEEDDEKDGPLGKVQKKVGKTSKQKVLKGAAKPGNKDFGLKHGKLGKKDGKEAPEEMVTGKRKGHSHQIRGNKGKRNTNGKKSKRG